MKFQMPNFPIIPRGSCKLKSLTNLIKLWNELHYPFTDDEYNKRVVLYYQLCNKKRFKLK